METYDWTTFTKRIPVSAGTGSLYTAWTTRAGLEKFFLRKAEFKSSENTMRNPNEYVQVGDSYEWMWFGYDDDTIERGQVLEVNGKDFLKFTFGKAGVVSIELKQEEGETVVELIQSEIPTDERSKVYYHLGCSEGWTFYLANLKSVAEGGLDLRNKNEKLKRVVSS